MMRLSCNTSLNVALLDACDIKEEGSSDGVSKEMYSNFFKELFVSSTVEELTKSHVLRMTR